MTLAIMIVYLGLLFLAPVVVVERTTAVEALGRSWRLAQGRKAKLLGTVLLVGLLFGSASGGIVLVGALGGFLGEGLEQQIVQQLLTQAVSVIAMPVWSSSDSLGVKFIIADEMERLAVAELIDAGLLSAPVAA